MTIKDSSVMLKVGLTGSIGSGKTVVAKIFEAIGAEVFYADAEARPEANHHTEGHSPSSPSSA